MKFHFVLFMTFIALLLAGCSESENASVDSMESTQTPPAEVSDAPVPATQPESASSKTEELKQAAKEWSDKTGELAEKTWDVTREKAGDVKEKSAEYYQAAKTTAIDVADQVSKKSAEVYEAGKEKGSEMLDGQTQPPPDETGL